MKEYKANKDKLFSDYGELYLLLETEPEVLHEAIGDCSGPQLNKILGLMEDQINDINMSGPSKIPLVQHHLTVWFIALRALDRQTGSSDREVRSKLDSNNLELIQE